MKGKPNTTEGKVDLTDIHCHGRYITLVGGAGSGKTTLLKRYCRMVIDKKALTGVELVHLINIRDLSKEKLTPEKMLFGNMLPGEQKEACVHYGYKWLQNEDNQEQVLLVFDGLDTAPWMLSDDHPKISYNDKESASTIIYNILRGHLFKKCKILLASREYGIRKFPVDIRPDAVIALKGFTRDSIKTLVFELGGNEGGEIWEIFRKKSANLMYLCSTPLFLIFTIIVYKRNKSPPENLSGIIITIIENHIRSNHWQGKHFRTIMGNLKILSHEALKDGRVLFSADELASSGLEVEDVKDLIINVPTPDPNIDSVQKLLEEDFSYYFCHQSFQESFGALRVSELPYNNFEEFVRKYLHTPKYIVVRQILYGVLFNKKTADLAKKQAIVEEKEKKQELLLSTLKEELEKKMDSSMDMLNLLISLRECGANEKIIGLIKGSLSRISLSGIPLNPNDMHAIASVARHSDRLDIMQLNNCDLDNYALEVLATGMRGSGVEITVFDVCFNRNLREDSMYYLNEICIRGQGLNYWQCSFPQRAILQFNKAKAEQEQENRNAGELNEASSEEVIIRLFEEKNVLELSRYNVENHLDTLKKMVKKSDKKSKIRLNVANYDTRSNVTDLCHLIKWCNNITEFALCESELSEEQLNHLKKATDGKKIETLNIFLNPDVQEKGWAVFGEIMAASSAKNLFITSCSLTESKLKELKSSIEGCKINKFDVSRNDDIDEKCLEQIGQIVVDCEVQELVMGYCAFKSDHIKHLKRSISKGKINRIDVSGNDEMGPEGYHALGEIVQSSEVKLLDISECDPSPEEVENFKTATGNANITKLNISRNRKMKKHGLKCVGEMVGKNNLDELFIRQCELKQDTLESFLEGLGEAKIRHLDIGLYFMEPRTTTEAEIKILMKILSHVKEQLTINGWVISVETRKAFQDKIDSLEGEGLKIMFDRGKEDFICQKPKKLIEIA